jgi:murein DD-endopeptidase MepM/ murein hydrolase activator NlpD
MDSIFYKFHVLIVIVGVLVIASLILLSFLISATNALSTNAPDNPNAVSRSFEETISGVGRSLSSARDSVTNSTKSAGSIPLNIGRFAASSGKFAVNSSKLIIRTINSGATSVFHSFRTGMVFALQSPGKVVASVDSVAITGAITRPADSTETPTITPHAIAAAPPAESPVKPVSQTPSPTTVAIQPAPQPVQDSEGTWPIHGAITTPFGVSDLPYERIHTGIDISDGKPAGTSPVHPFKPGRVTAAVHSRSGLGDYVIVDHGGGVTSVYGHLARISALVGASVDQSSTLGFEGSTGASTGTHLHFEIRLNAQPVNPKLYLSGRP